MKGDFYPTPVEAVFPLIPHLPLYDFTFAEPCAGDYRLAKYLQDLTGGRAQPREIIDLEPQSELVTEMDALELKIMPSTEFIITNPPWSRPLLHPMIEHFSKQAPTWLLFDADWMHTKQAIPYLKHCRKIVSVGRVKWIEGSKSIGKDNSAWYLFEQTPKSIEGTSFIGRTLNKT